MTRINVVPVQILSDKHLMAEYKEITRPFNKVRKHIKAGRKPSDLNIPDVYCMGKGHETFFYDKLDYLCRRYYELFVELRARDFKPDVEKFWEIRGDFIMSLDGTPFWGGYEPTHEAIYLNMARLAKRSNMPHVLAELESDK